MKKGRIFCQTLATDLIQNLSKAEEMLALQYLSALSIKKQLSKEDKFILITDSLGKSWTKHFPYDEIRTSLDDYPNKRPYMMSIYKHYAIHIFKNKTFIHFDNDVILFKAIPEFKDTIVQSSELNFTQKMYANKTRLYDWILPKYITEIEENYNPGIFGFTADSVVRDEYYEIATEYSNKNIDFVNEIESSIDKRVYLTGMQDVYLFLEESLLWYLCNKKNKIDVLEFVPNKYKGHEDIWGQFHNGKYGPVDWTLVFSLCYEHWREQEYAHLMNYKTLLANDSDVYLPQAVLLELYYRNKEDITNFLKEVPWNK